MGLFGRIVGLFGRTVGLFRRNVGLFRRTVGLFRRIVGLFGRTVGLFRRNVGLFGRTVGLFRRIVRLFWRIVRLFREKRTRKRMPKRVSCYVPVSSNNLRHPSRVSLNNIPFAYFFTKRPSSPNNPTIARADSRSQYFPKRAFTPLITRRVGKILFDAVFEKNYYLL